MIVPPGEKCGLVVSGAIPSVNWPVVLGLCLLLSPAGRPAERPAENTPAAGGIRFCVPLWVLEEGAPIQPRIGRGDLSIFAGSSPLQITRQEQPGTPTLLFLAFDLVEDQPSINAAKQALADEIRKLGPEYWVGLIGAQETLSVIQDPTKDKPLLLKKIRQSRQFGKAGLLESIQALADFSSSLMLRSNVRVGVILVTDSDVANYRTEYRNPTINRSDRRDLSRRFSGRALQEDIYRISTAMVRFPVPLLVVHVAPGRDSLNRTYQDGLGQVTGAVGGRIFLSKSTGDIPRTLQEAFEWADSFYAIEFEVPPRPGGVFEIEAKLGAALSPTMRLSYPARLFFPSETGP